LLYILLVMVGALSVSIWRPFVIAGVWFLHAPCSS